ncbi:MAG TPA: PEP-CTERM sorting domain-containing protein, partial [Gemmataceae bacterium]|nr:PEP-CTERM sorting domain-containing protein [Gemmataceae bacterium]
FRFDTHITGSTGLAPGTYVIGAYYSSSSTDEIASLTSGMTWGSGITFLADRMTSNSGGLVMPGPAPGSFDPAFFGPDFQFSPEPSSFLLASLGALGGAAAWWRRRRRAPAAVPGASPPT